MQFDSVAAAMLTRFATWSTGINGAPWPIRGCFDSDADAADMVQAAFLDAFTQLARSNEAREFYASCARGARISSTSRASIDSSANGDGTLTLTLSDSTHVRVSRRRAAQIERALDEIPRTN